MSLEDNDPLKITPPAGIPGVLFARMAERLYDHYPASKRKAERVTVNLLELLTEFYEEAAKMENE